MKESSLKYLSKEDLIEIIKADEMWRVRAFMKVNEVVFNKINSILDQMEKCDLKTKQGWDKYKKLDKEYEKWSKVQANL